MDPEFVDVSRQLHTLTDAGIPYLVIHKRAPLKEGHIASWRQWLGVEPAYEDAELAVFRTDLRLGRDFEMHQLLAEDIGIIKAGFSPKEALQDSAVTIETYWSTKTRLDQDYDACIQFIDNSGEVARTDCRLLASYRPTSKWEANELVRGVRSLTIDPFFDPGAYTVVLSLAEKESGQLIGEQVDLGQLIVTPLPRVFETPAPSQPVEARWEQQLALPGYDLVESADDLRLTLYWQALERMDASYKVFVHLIDEATGEVVAQDDAIPRQWTYPTNMWEKGEVIEDTIALASGDLPAGRYRLQVGVYDPDSGERLQAFSADGTRYPDDSVPLATISR